MVRTSEPATSSRRSERMVTLLAILREHGEVQLRDIATTLGTSVATIRRDVAVLAEQGLLIRTHGGARSTGPDGELPVNLRDGRHHQAKQAIARTAVAELPRGRHAIALTGGTTTAEVVRALHHRHDLTIVTNSVSIALEAARHGQQRVLITGGVLRSSSLELVGPLAENTFKLANIGTAIVGCDGLSVAGGLTTHDPIEAATNHTMIRQAPRVIAVVDGSKIGQVTLAKMSETKDIDVLITDDTADAREISRIRSLGVTVRIVTDPNCPPDPRANTS